MDTLRILCAVCLAALCAHSAEERPNILLIVIDDMGYSDIGPFGSEIRTPNLDSLAARGACFTSFYTGAACSPTRSMLMSGTDNHIAGMGNNAEALAPNQVGKPGYEGYLNDRVVSLASLLKDSGYHTCMAGKWHLGEELEHDPSRRGFDKSYVLLQGGASHFDDEWMMCANYTPTYRENGTRVHVPRDFFSSEFYTDKLIEYIDGRDKGKPFFAYLAYTAVHDPLHLPDDWLERCKGRYDLGYDALREQRLVRMKGMGLVPKNTKLADRIAMVPAWDTLSPDQKKAQSRIMEIYAAMVENTDHHIGRMIAYLQSSGVLDDTLVVFFSDNGANGAPMHMYPGTDEAWVERNSDNRFENWGRRGSRIAEGPGWAQASVTPFSLFKGFVADGGIRSPLIISGPQVKKHGSRSDGLAHVMDLAPTFLELAGATYPAKWKGREIVPLRGRSLVPMITGAAGAVRGPEETLGWEMMNWRAVRMGEWKITRISSPFGSDDWQLFNLARDPGETDDLSDAFPDVFQKLLQQWDVYEQDVGIIYPAAGIPMNF